ncbi:hypothetical protein [Halomonas huangheensis]|nr:hypothetical protein [Halomonas huangheensis]ALM54575.1 hypothetical protein AR456_07130 [Halomonas huangheensis]
MLISDSMSLLWMIYAALSLLVLLTGYLGLSFLPRLPRIVLTWTIAGVMWMPATFELPLVEEGKVYVGKAPGIMVAAVSFFEHGSNFAGAAALVVVGAVIGALFGLVLWWFGRKRIQQRAAATRQQAQRDQDDEGGRPGPGNDGQRREPVLG